jgi:hypothetical protein
MSHVKLRRDVESTDAAELSATTRSPGFALVNDRLQKQRQDYIGQLILAPTWEECRYLQGQIAGVERSIAVPGILRSEFMQKDKQR